MLCFLNPFWSFICAGHSLSVYNVRPGREVPEYKWLRLTTWPSFLFSKWGSLGQAIVCHNMELPDDQASCVGLSICWGATQPHKLCTCLGCFKSLSYFSSYHICIVYNYLMVMSLKVNSRHFFLFVHLNSNH